MKSAKEVAAEQAEDDSLWFRAETITETVLQRALRRLHAAVENDELVSTLMDVSSEHKDATAKRTRPT